MPSLKLSCVLVVAIAGVAPAADHREAPLIREDLTADIADVYAFLNPDDPDRLVLAMTVNPGYSGQKFISSVLPKIREIRDRIDTVNPTCDLEVDGGVNEATGPQVVNAGANVLVAATAIFKHPDGISAGIQILRHQSDPQTTLV